MPEIFKKRSRVDHFPYFRRMVASRESQKSCWLVYDLHGPARLDMSCHELYQYLYGNSETHSREYRAFIRRAYNNIELQNSTQPQQSILKELFEKSNEDQMLILKSILQNSDEPFPPLDFKALANHGAKEYHNQTTQKKLAQVLRERFSDLRDYEYTPRATRKARLRQRMQAYGSKESEIPGQIIEELNADIPREIANIEVYCLEDLLNCIQPPKESRQVLISALKICLIRAAQLPCVLQKQQIVSQARIHPKNIILLEQCRLFHFDLSHVWLQSLALNQHTASLEQVIVFHTPPPEWDVFTAIDRLHFKNGDELKSYLSQDKYFKDLRSTEQSFKQEHNQPLFNSSALHKMLESLKAALILYHFSLGEPFFQQTSVNQIKYSLIAVVDAIKIIPWLQHSPPITTAKFELLQKIYLEIAGSETDIHQS